MSALRWLRAEWPAPADVIAGTTLRQGGISRGSYATLNLAAHVGDDAEHVAENRRRFRTTAGLPAEPLWLKQVHGTDVARAEGADGELRAEGAALAPTADGAVTSRPDTVLAILTADCLPVVLASVDGRECAVAHAGWRGLSAGILEATVAAMPVAPAKLLAWLGPAVSQRAFEVGDEVRDAFVSRDGQASGAFLRNERGRWQADLYALATLRLQQAGITAVYGGGRCTRSEPEAFFSYRRDGQCGRMATFIFRRAGR